MARLRASGITAAGGGSPARLRAAGISAAGAAAAARLRAAGLSAAGAAVTTVARLRAVGISAAGTGTVVINPIAAREAGPMEAVVLLASTQGGASVDSWTWRRISGPVVTLTQLGAQVSLTVPSLTPPNTQTLVLGVTATQGATTSAEVVVNITVLPQLEWTWNATSSQWVGSVSAPA